MNHTLKYPLIICLCLLLIPLSSCALLMQEPGTPARFEIRGNKAYMSGVIDSSITEDLKCLLKERPEVTTIVMVEVDGSVDDEANLEAARFIRERGLNTHIPVNGTIASGGTDFFLAGVKRTMDPGARMGVHSWAEVSLLGSVTPADQFPRDHEIHERYLSYYREMDIADDFYWFTLSAAPAHGIHWMTPEEVKKYGMLTPDTRS